MKRIYTFLIFTQLFFFLSSLELSHAQNVPDFIISDYGTRPNMALDSKKNMHVVWDSIDLGSYIRYAVYDSLGKNIKPPRILTQDLSASQADIKINGAYAAVAWTELSQTFNSYVFGKVINILDDTILNNEILINDVFFDAYRDNPNISFINDTTFVVVWFGGGPMVDQGVFGQIITTSLNKIGKNFLISDNGGTEVRYGEAKVLSFPSNDDFVVIWRDDHTGTARVYGRLFYFDGVPKNSSFLISEDPDIDDMFFLSAAMDNSDNFAVVWGAEKDSIWEIQWRWFNINGNPFGLSRIIATNSINSFPTVDIAIDKDGKGIIVWEKGTNNAYNLYAQRFLANREFLGDQFKLSSSPDTNFQVLPNIVLEHGKVFSVWGESRGANRIIAGNIVDFYNPPTEVKQTENIQSPDLFHLLQNYPNPFNPSTKIEFYIYERSFVSLKVYDLLGNEIRTLVNSELEPGNYQIYWKGDNQNQESISAGIYFCKLSTRGRSEIKKMLLIK